MKAELYARPRRKPKARFLPAGVVQSNATMTDDATRHDAQKRYCPKLGHDVPFRYCRAAGAGVPCRNLRGCWGGRIDVEGWLASHCDPDAVGQLDAPKPDKLCTIVDLIRRAQQAGGTQDQ